MNKIKQYFAIYSTLGLAALGACTPIVSRHGFISDDDKPVVAKVGIDTKSTLLAKYGNPVQNSVFDEQTWFYIGSMQKQTAFFTPVVKTRNVTIIKFDDTDKVTDINQVALKDGRVIAYNKKTTPTRGREVTLLEQVLGSVGHSTVALPNTDPNLPTAAGGPRRQ